MVYIYLVFLVMHAEFTNWTKEKKNKQEKNRVALILLFNCNFTEINKMAKKAELNGLISALFFCSLLCLKWYKENAPQSERAYRRWNQTERSRNRLLLSARAGQSVQLIWKFASELKWSTRSDERNWEKKKKILLFMHFVCHLFSAAVCAFVVVVVIVKLEALILCTLCLCVDIDEIEITLKPNLRISLCNLNTLGYLNREIKINSTKLNSQNGN